jgi:hypothetical protein
MDARQHHPAVYFAPAALLVAALAPWPYGYYTIRRAQPSLGRRRPRACMAPPGLEGPHYTWRSTSSLPRLF